MSNKKTLVATKAIIELLNTQLADGDLTPEDVLPGAMRAVRRLNRRVIASAHGDTKLASSDRHWENEEFCYWLFGFDANGSFRVTADQPWYVVEGAKRSYVFDPVTKNFV